MMPFKTTTLFLTAPLSRNLVHLSVRLQQTVVMYCNGLLDTCCITRELRTPPDFRIEQGRCYNLTNQEILSRVRRWETSSNGCRNLLTVPRIGWHDDEQKQTVRDIATAASFSGTCYVCPVCRRGFNKLGSLNQHLSSNVHESSEFRCWKCFKRFVELSALVAHVESGCCGAMSATSMRNVISGFGKMLLNN